MLYCLTYRTLPLLFVCYLLNTLYQPSKIRVIQRLPCHCINSNPPKVPWDITTKIASLRLSTNLAKAKKAVLMNSITSCVGLTFMHMHSENGNVAMMRRIETSARSNAQQPGPSGSAEKKQKQEHISLVANAIFDIVSST